MMRIFVALDITIWLLICFSLARWGFADDAGIKPTEVPVETVEHWEEILRNEASSHILSHVIQVDFEVVEPYIRDNFLSVIRDAEDLATTNIYENLLSLPSGPVSLRYFDEASRSKEPLLRSLGLRRLIQARGSEADLERALHDGDVMVRCEGIGALLGFESSKAILRLKRVKQWNTTLERCEAAATLIRLGETGEGDELEKALRLLGSELPGLEKSANRLWLVRRVDYYGCVLESCGGRHQHYHTELGEAFPAALSLFGEPYDYLERTLTRYSTSEAVDERSLAVRCLGRIPEPWATRLLKARLNDDEIGVLNSSGYGWHASVSCLSAVCLLERGDGSGLPVLRAWVKKHRDLIDRNRIFPSVDEEGCGFEPNEYAALRDTGPAVALARAGYKDSRDVLEVLVDFSRGHLREGTPDEGLIWLAYHLTISGSPKGLECLTSMKSEAEKGIYYKEELKLEAAGCLIALARERKEPLVFAPAVAGYGPLLYPDCYHE